MEFKNYLIFSLFECGESGFAGVDIESFIVFSSSVVKLSTSFGLVGGDIGFLLARGFSLTILMNSSLYRNSIDPLSVLSM